MGVKVLHRDSIWNVGTLQKKGGEGKNRVRYEGTEYVWPMDLRTICVWYEWVDQFIKDSSKSPAYDYVWSVETGTTVVGEMVYLAIY